jgi:DNA-binding transcriptional MerR regulator
VLIGELSRRTGVSARMLRHYDSVGLMSPTGRSSGGYRDYSRNDIHRIFQIESLRSLGLSLREVKRALDDPDFAPTALVGQLIEQTQQRIARENELLARLRQVGNTDPETWGDVLRLVELVRDLGSDRPGRRQQAVLAAADQPSVPAAVLADALLAEAEPNVAGALRWALARMGTDGLDSLATGLDSADVHVRRRAVLAIAEFADAESTTLLESAVSDSDTVVRRYAALELGSRGHLGAVPALIEVVVDGSRDVEAAETLGQLAHTPQLAEEIVGALETALIDSADEAVRSRLTQALTEIPGPSAHQALSRLTQDQNQAVALTARSILEMRHRT